MNSYQELKGRHQAEWDNFPMKFAFNNEQFERGMRELGLEPTDTDKVYKLSFAGGFYRKADAPVLHEMTARHEKEMEDAINGDATGDGFMFDMFYYELGNHEYTYTGELGQTLAALGMTMKDIRKDPRMRHGLEKAMKEQWASLERREKLERKLEKEARV
jgi:hypothetical protein